MKQQGTGEQEVWLLSVPEAARLLGIGDDAVWKLVARGELPSVRLGKYVRVPRTALARRIAQLTRKGSESGKYHQDKDGEG